MNDSLRLPSFLVVGAAKSGTTALYEYLIRHPSIYLSSGTKESRFLTGLTPITDPEICRYVRVVTSFEEYAQLFNAATPDQIIGEVDPWLLYLHQRSVQRIIHYLEPQVKLIVILREPVSRAYSHYYHIVKQGWTTTTFEQIAERFIDNGEDMWFHRMIFEASQYSEQLATFLDVFDRQNMLILRHNEMHSNLNGVVQRVFDFLGVDPHFEPDKLFKANVGGIPRNRQLHSILTKKTLMWRLVKPMLPISVRRKLRYSLVNRNLRRYPPLAMGLRQELRNYYRDDVLRSQELINDDLSDWLN